MKKTLIIFTVLLVAVSAEARLPQRGYRGFFELSSSLRSENFGYPDMNGNLLMYRDNTFYTGFSTSHGYQINPLFFIGAGLGMERCGSLDKWVAPIFLEGRIDLKIGKFTPFGDLRLGASVAEGAGGYCS
ncbi:MAG: hypothetical protein K2O27_00145, partial [Candidatus Amulumruptor sp.]|nr:hypothetical protein [Candidatus Amulumruptor sp.]